MTRTIIAVALAAMLLSGVGAQAAKSPTIKQVNKKANQALSTSKRALRTAQDAKSREDEQDTAIADNRRAEQVNAGRIAILPDTFNANVTHQHESSPAEITVGQTGTATATCSPGEAATGGGYKLEYGGTPERPTVTSQLPAADSHTVEAQNLDGTATATLRAIVSCIER